MRYRGADKVQRSCTGRIIPERGCGKRSRLSDNTRNSRLLSRMYRAYIRQRGIMPCQRQRRCSVKRLVAKLLEHSGERVRRAFAIDPLTTISERKRGWSEFGN